MDDNSTIKLDSLSGKKAMYETAAFSIQGSRAYQQDFLVTEFSERSGLAVLCDGMGGMNAGELASRMTAETFVQDYRENVKPVLIGRKLNFGKEPEPDFLKSETRMSDNESGKEEPDSSKTVKMPGEKKEFSVPDFLTAEAYKLNNMVAGLKDEYGRPLGSGTTMVAALFDEGRLHWLSVGDSRIYIIRGNEKVIVTRAHNYRLSLDTRLREGIISEEEYKAEEPRAAALISFIGIGELRLMDVNRTPFELQEDDMVLLCSDGLYNCLSDEEIMAVLCGNQRNLQEKGAELIREVNLKGKKYQDNTSLILIKYNFQ